MLLDSSQKCVFFFFRIALVVRYFILFITYMCLRMLVVSRGHVCAFFWNSLFFSFIVYFALLLLSLFLLSPSFLLFSLYHSPSLLLLLLFPSFVSYPSFLLSIFPLFLPSPLISPLHFLSFTFLPSPAFKAVKNPDDILSTDRTSFKALIDVHLCEHTGFTPFLKFKGNRCVWCRERERMI
jgi:hypothetical protein